MSRYVRPGRTSSADLGPQDLCLSGSPFPWVLRDSRKNSGVDLRSDPPARIPALPSFFPDAAEFRGRLEAGRKGALGEEDGGRTGGSGRSAGTFP